MKTDRELLELAARVKRQYCASVFVILFCVLVMCIAPIYVEGYMWQFMLLPIAINLHVAISARSALIKSSAITRAAAEIGAALDPTNGTQTPSR